MVSAWDRLEVRVNRRVAATFPTSMSYADTAGHTDSFVAVYDEFENKWDAMVTAIERVLSLTPEIGIDIPNREAFSVLFEALSPELYTSIQVVKRQIKNEKQKQEERRTWWKHEHS